MIIRYFRTNQSVILLSLPLIGLLFWAIHFFDSDNAFMVRGFLFEKFFNIIRINSLFSKIIALSLICFQAYLINRILIQSEVFSKTTHIPLLILIVLASMLSFRGGLEPMLMANIFLIIAISSTLKIYHQNSAISLTFDVGFWIGMAGLFEPACLLLLIPSLVSILILRAADWRELFFLLVGGAIPTFFLWVICFITDTTLNLSYDYFKLTFNDFPHEKSSLFIFLVVFIGIILIWSFYFYIKSLRGIIIRVRKMRMVLLYYSFSLLLIYGWLFFTPFLPAQNQILLIPGVILISYLIIHHPKPLLIDTFIYLMIVIWFTFVYNLYFG